MGKIFRKAFMGGFRKKDVIKYLETMGEEKRELEKRIEELSQANVSAAEDIPEQCASEQMAELESKLQKTCEDAQATIDLLKGEITDLRCKNAELKKREAEEHSRHCPELTLAIKCPGDNASADARRAEEALMEFRKSIDEITTEFSKLLDNATNNAPQTTGAKLSSIKEILDRVKKVAEK